MKKTICVVLALMMALGCVSAWAEDVTGDAADVTLKMRTLLGISEDYTRFSSDYSYNIIIIGIFRVLSFVYNI